MTITVDAEQNETFKALLRSQLIDTLRDLAVEKLVLVAAYHNSSSSSASEQRAQHLADATGLSMLATMIEAERTAMLTSHAVDRLIKTVRETTAFGKSKTFESVATMIEEMFD